MRDFQKPERSEVFSSNGMIATSHPLAAKIGIDAMSKGGNAIDGAITAALMLVLCEPQSTGLFGDAFAIIKSKKSDGIIGLNGSGRAPMALSSNTLLSKNIEEIPLDSPHSVTVPGAVSLFEEIADKFGNLGLKELCKQPIRYAEEGVVVSPRVSFDWYTHKKKLTGASEKFYLDSGKAYKAGSLFKAPMQAEVFRQIAAQGSKGFYESDVTVDLVNSLKELGGVHTLADFENVKVQYVDPIHATLKDGSTLIELPPNGQGITAIMMKKIMEFCNIEQFSADSFERVHLEAEIAKIAYSARNSFIGDPQFSEIKQNIFLDYSYLEELSKEITLGKLLRNELETNFFTRNKDTVLICAADNEGNAISLIFSTFHAFGSGLCSNKFGLLFHNRGAGFALKKNHPNELLGGKRPLHTIIPAIVKEKDGSIMPFGVMGGQYQANGHARILSNIKDYGMGLQESLNFPRSFYFDGILSLEKGYPSIIKEKLREIGYKIEEATIPIGGAQLVRIDSSGVLIGASDPRKDGCALGF